MSNGSSTWEWDGENWTKKSPVSKPPPRLFPALTFDSIREKVVLFGEKAFLNPLNDTWEWDGVDWTQKFPAASPPGRNAFALTYDDAHGRALLFGGYDESNETNLNDTWEWDGVDWAQKFPLASPSKRSWHGLAYDSIRGRVVLFGPTETWEWDGAAWMQKFPAMSPPVRSNHALTFDGARGKVVLFGGSIGSIYLDDTWEWDGQGRGYPGQQVAVAVMSTGVIGGDASADIKQVYIKFISGGAGYPQGVVTNGVNLLAWYDDQWQVLASNSDGPKTPGLVEWTTTDAAAIKKLMLNPKQAFNFAVVPQAPNGFGHPNCPSDWTAEECDMGMVSTEYVEVTLRYTLP
jgi:hypothetical protein